MCVVIVANRTGNDLKDLSMLGGTVFREDLIIGSDLGIAKQCNLGVYRRNGHYMSRVRVQGKFGRPHGSTR